MVQPGMSDDNQFGDNIKAMGREQSTDGPQRQLDLVAKNCRLISIDDDDDVANCSLSDS